MNEGNRLNVHGPCPCQRCRYHGKTWEQIARVAKGMQLDDPVNWPHYADEARKLVDQLATAVLTLERIRGHANSGDDPALLAQHELDRLRGVK